MKRISLVLAVTLIAASILSGCVIVPVDGWYGGGWRHHRYEQPYGYRYGYPPPYYRGR